MGTLEAVLGNIATQTAVAGGGTTPVPATTEAPPPNEPAETEAAATEPPAEEPEETQAPPEEEAGGEEQAPQEEEPQEQEPQEENVEIPEVEVPENYTLQKGEFPYCIARRFDLNPGELLSLNGLNNNSKPGVGFRLTIPQTGNGFPGDRSLRDHPADYTVSSGDTLYSIACLYGDVTPEAIAAVNDMDVSDTPDAGDRIRIP
jgi:LysM repeat protein